MCRDDYTKGLSVCHDCGRLSLASEQGADPNCDGCTWDGERVSQVSIREWVSSDGGVIETIRSPYRAVG
jgi:hypothetical protein